MVLGLQDVTIDCPQAPKNLALFLSKMIIGEVVSPKYLRVSDGW